VPEGTYLGWNLRKPGYGEGDLCLIFGSYLPFPANDPRLPTNIAARRAAAEAALAAARLVR
jgi:hypothetical protein